MSITLAQEVRLLAAVDCLEILSEEELEKFAKRHPDLHFEPGEIIPAAKPYFPEISYYLAL